GRCAGDVGIAKHVRMSPHKLVLDRPGGELEVTVAGLLQEKGQEKALEEEVAELVQELRVVAGKRGIRHLVRLLDRVRHDRLRRLLAIPGAVAPQPLRELLELEQRVRQCHPTAWSSCRSCSSPSRAPCTDPDSAGSRAGT